MIDTPTTPERIIEAAMMNNAQRKNMTTQEMRELDAWIAEHVMGWREGRSGLQSRHDPSNDSWMTPKHSYRFKHSWKPTVDPADAMQVLEKCGERDTVCVYKSCIGLGNPIMWFVSGYDYVMETHAPTLPLAICLFAKELFSK